MGNVKTEAIAVRYVKYSDTMMMAHLYTKEKGMMCFAVSGTHSKRSRLRQSMFLPLTLLEIEYEERHTEIQRLRDAKPSHIFTTMPYDAHRNAVSFFVSEMIYKTQTEPAGDERVFELLRETILKMDDRDVRMGNFHIVFLLRYAEAMGFGLRRETYEEGMKLDMSDGTFTKGGTPLGPMMPEDESETISKLINLGYEDGGKVNIGREMKKRLTLDMVDYYSLHTGMKRELKSLDVLYELF